MARRLYLGRLPPDSRAEDVQKMFDGYGRIIDCRVMTGFGFVEFESSRDAEEAVHQFNGKSFMGNNIVVEFAKETKPRREPYDTYDRGPPRIKRPPGVRLLVEGISRDTSWQDLKDFGREAGNVSYADIDRDIPGQGVLEYLSRDDADHAVKFLDNKDLRGQPVRVSISEDRGGPDNFRRDDRRDDRYSRDDRHRDDRYDRHSRDDRYSRDDAKYRDIPRRRSLSPPPRGRDDRARSPPRRDYDDKRGGYDDRRGAADRGAAADPAFDKRRDDRRRDERDVRYDDRPSRHSNGDGSWTRP